MDREREREATYTHTLTPLRPSTYTHNATDACPAKPTNIHPQTDTHKQTPQTDTRYRHPQTDTHKQTPTNRHTIQTYAGK